MGLVLNYFPHRCTHSHLVGGQFCQLIVKEQGTAAEVLKATLMLSFSPLWDLSFSCYYDWKTHFKRSQVICMISAFCFCWKDKYVF